MKKLPLSTLKPEDHKKIADFTPGQYISIKLEIAGEKFTHIRQYSLSDAPGKDYYRISVKREAGMENPDGMVSNYLHDGVNQGDILKVSAPAGDFMLDTEKNSPVVLLSGGVGLTPMMSMLKTVVEVQPERKVTFVHAAANGNVHALRDEVEEVSTLENVTSYVFYDSPTEEDRLNNRFDVEGYVTRDWLNEKIDTKDADFYFCGPVPFMKAINRSLKELGVNEEKIHFEFFRPDGEFRRIIEKQPISKNGSRLYLFLFWGKYIKSYQISNLYIFHTI